MNLEENKLDDLFRERLKHFAPEPPPEMWNRISRGMDRKKAFRRVIIYRWMGAAAVLLLAMVTGILVTRNDPTLPVKDVSKEISLKPEEKPENLPVQNRLETNRNTLFKTQALNADRVTGKTPADSMVRADNQNLERVDYLAVNSGRGTLQKTEVILKRVQPDYAIQITRVDKTSLLKGSPPADQKLLAMGTGRNSRNNKTDVEWKVGLQLAPAFSSHTSGYASSYARSMITTGKPAQTGMGGGISVQVKTSRRWTFESGLYYSRNGDKSSTTGHLLAANADYSTLGGGSNRFYSSAVVLKDGQMTMNSTAGVIHFTQTPENAKLISSSESAIGMNSVLLMSGDFFQVFDFMEMPLTTRYRIIDSKIDMELLSGLSANLVVGNQVIMGNASTREYVGKTDDISRLGFSGVAGFGIIYPLSKRISLTIEPRASYWLTSLNHSSEVDFRPWRIGIYSGLTFGF